MESLPLQAVAGWSREAEAQLALLQQSPAVQKLAPPVEIALNAPAECPTLKDVANRTPNRTKFSRPASASRLNAERGRRAYPNPDSTNSFISENESAWKRTGRSEGVRSE
jgi:hypothetical protein